MEEAIKAAETAPADPLEVIMAPGPEVTIAGKSYTMRRLNTLDVFKAARILSKGMRQAAPALMEKEVSPQLVGLLLVSAIPYAEAEAIAFLSDTIGLSPDEFAKLPPEALILVGEALAKHQDMAAFFDAVLRVLGQMGIAGIQKLSS